MGEELKEEFLELRKQKNQIPNRTLPSREISSI